MKDLLRRFLDFFISYGLELGQEPKDSTFSELVQKLQSLSAYWRQTQSLQIVPGVTLLAACSHSAAYQPFSASVFTYQIEQSSSITIASQV